MTNQLTFIFADDVGRTQATDRLLIRSHVMKGKNQKDTSRRSIRKAKQGTSTSVEKVGHAGVNQSSHDHGTTQHRQVPYHAEQRNKAALVIHKPVASELGLASFANHVDRQAQELLWKCEYSLTPPSSWPATV